MKNFDIFISYRAGENRQKAEHLYFLLDRRFPGQVSYDKETFGNGRWDKQIFQRIDHCKDVVVLLTPETFARSKEDDASKYERWAHMPVGEVLPEIEKDSDVDILRTEISRAIALGKNVIPIVHMPGRTKFSDIRLPSDIAALTRFEGVLYNDDDPNLLMASLVPKIIRLLKTRKSRWWLPVVVVLPLLVALSVVVLRVADARSSWDALSRCRTQQDYENMLECGNRDVVQAARDSIDEFGRLKRNPVYVNVGREDSVSVSWSHDVTLLQLRAIRGLLDSMVYVERGEFVMGDELWEDIDGPRHKVVLTEDYYVSKYELTRDVWYAVMADSAVEQDARHPITNVSFIDALQFVEKINHFANMVKQFVPLAFSLPTEAQWEYAARGGRYEAYAGGENANNVAYWRGNSQNGTHPVGSLSPNSRELYDMSGNVGEWCLDGEMEPYSGRTETDPLHEEGGDRRVIRGGSYASDLDDLRVGHREHFKADQNSDVIGIRLIMKKQL